MPTYKLMIGRFPYGSQEDSRCVDWLIKTALQISRDKRFDLHFAKLDDTPITMTRNAMFEEAIRQGMDYLLIVDSDIEPDCELAEDPTAKPFFWSSIEWMLRQPKPTIVGAPYCGPPPMENMYVFLWGGKMSEDPDFHGSIDQYTREHAAMLSGIQEVAALPTGLMLIDMRAFEGIKPPYTYYEWKNECPPCPACGCRKPGPQSEKASTEDVTFTRDLALAGVKQYCNWDAWAAHIKKKRVRKPRPYTTDMVAERMREAVVRNVHAGDRVVEVQSDRFEADIAAAMARPPLPVPDRRPDAVLPVTAVVTPGPDPEATLRTLLAEPPQPQFWQNAEPTPPAVAARPAAPPPDPAGSDEGTRAGGIKLTMEDILGTL